MQRNPLKNPGATCLAAARALPDTGGHPPRPEAGQVTFAARLSGSVNALMKADPDAVRVSLFSEALEWTDGPTGRHMAHAPMLLVHWSHGAKTYVDVMETGQLERDCGLRGTRRGIEAGCRAKGAAYETWTEVEVERLQRPGSLIRPADGQERAAYATALAQGSPGPAVLSLIRKLADHARLKDCLAVGDAWIGRDTLTGVPNVIMGNIRIDPGTRMAIWTPPRHFPAPVAASEASRGERRRAAALVRSNSRQSGRAASVGTRVTRVAAR